MENKEVEKNIQTTDFTHFGIIKFNIPVYWIKVFFT